MPHDIFVSHSTKDKIAADAVVAHLESSGLRCWCAPRDILPGESWASAIVRGISECKAMVIVFSANANESDHIRREVERAVGHGVPVVPVRIEDVMPKGDLEYFLSSSHWMDAITPPVERHFDELAERLRTLLKLDKKSSLPASSITAPTSVPAIIKGSPIVKITLAAAALIALVIVGILLMRPKAVPVVESVTVVPIPAPSPAPIAPRAEPAHQEISAPSPLPAPIANPAPAPVAPAGESPLAGEYRDWKKLTMTIWDNTYLLDHSRQRHADWRRAADQGDPIGEFFVGYCYQHGLSVPEDPTTAFAWFSKSAEGGNSDGMLEVAVCSVVGLGTGQNVLEYARWIKQSVNAGNTSAMVVMGIGLFTTPLTPNDKEEGKKWIDKAAAAENLDGALWSAIVHSNSPAELVSKMPAVAALGHPDAMIATVEANPTAPQARKMFADGLQKLGNPTNVARIIDSTLPGGFYHNNIFPDLTAARLREMSAKDSAEATRLIATLTQSGKLPAGR